jgi:hypothetical protein
MATAKTWRPHLKNARLRRVSAQNGFEGHAFRKTMTTIVQVEFRESLLSVREETLQSLGHPVISALGLRAARNLDLSHESVGVVLIGHGAPWVERCDLAAHFRNILPGVPIVALLRQRDQDLIGADYNLRADDPPLWVSTVRQALAGIG